MSLPPTSGHPPAAAAVSPLLHLHHSGAATHVPRGGAQDGDRAPAAEGARSRGHLGRMVDVDTLLQVLRGRCLHPIPRVSNE